LPTVADDVEQNGITASMAVQVVAREPDRVASAMIANVEVDR
jgi:hypothetical protein